MSKSALMLIGSRQKLKGHSVSICIGGRLLPQVQSMKYLGVVIDQHLTWKFHIEYILKRVYTKLYGLHRLKPLPNSLLAMHPLLWIYFAIFDYCDAVWSPSF